MPHRLGFVAPFSVKAILCIFELVMLVFGYCVCIIYCNLFSCWIYYDWSVMLLFHYKLTFITNLALINMLKSVKCLLRWMQNPAAAVNRDQATETVS